MIGFNDWLLVVTICVILKPSIYLSIYPSIWCVFGPTVWLKQWGASFLWNKEKKKKRYPLLWKFIGMQWRLHCQDVLSQLKFKTVNCSNTTLKFLLQHCSDMVSSRYDWRQRTQWYLADTISGRMKSTNMVDLCVNKFWSILVHISSMVADFALLWKLLFSASSSLR